MFKFDHAQTENNNILWPIRTHSHKEYVSSQFKIKLKKTIINKNCNKNINNNYYGKYLIKFVPISNKNLHGY